MVAISPLAVGGMIYFYIAIAIFMVASLWAVFVKADQPGWAALVPIYNFVVLHHAAGKPAWWVILYLIPGVSIIISLLVMLGLAENFGRGAGFGIGLFFLGPIFMPILAFSDIDYEGA